MFIEHLLPLLGHRRYHLTATAARLLVLNRLAVGRGLATMVRAIMMKNQNSSTTSRTFFIEITHARGGRDFGRNRPCSASQVGAGLGCVSRLLGQDSNLQPSG
jgi:hypothetical protein